MVKSNPFRMDKLVTVGVKHIKFWQHSGTKTVDSLLVLAFWTTQNHFELSRTTNNYSTTTQSHPNPPKTTDNIPKPPITTPEPSRTTP